MMPARIWRVQNFQIPAKREETFEDHRARLSNRHPPSSMEWRHSAVQRWRANGNRAGLLWRGVGRRDPRGLDDETRRARLDR